MKLSGEEMHKNGAVISCQIGLGVFMATLALVPTAFALELATDDPDLSLRWDNTIRGTGAFRLKNPSALLTASVNQDDGDRNFKRGLISERLDLLSEFDISYKKSFGARISGAAWYDEVYNRATDNNSPATYNAFSVSNRQFPPATEKLHGRKGEILDAFVYAKGELGQGVSGVIRAGSHA
ncbi:MAG: DUF1302 domain-containing protein, partial [Bacteroidota bacterium]